MNGNVNGPFAGFVYALFFEFMAALVILMAVGMLMLVL